jgi:hypothetical protein
MITPDLLVIPIKKWTASIAEANFNGIYSQKSQFHPLRAATWYLYKRSLLEIKEVDTCEQTYLYNRSRWLQYKKTITNTIKIMSGSGLELVLLKGIDLITNLYPDKGIRHLGDVDILIKPDDIIKVVTILLKNDFLLSGVKDKKEAIEWLRITKNIPSELVVVHWSGLYFELHQHLVSSNWYKGAYPIDMDRVWQNSVKNNFFNKQSNNIRVFSPEDNIAYLILHLANHGMGYQALHNFLDLDLIIRNSLNELDWSLIRENIISWRLSTAANFVFSFCSKYLDTPLPDGFLDSLPHHLWSRLVVLLLLKPVDLITGRETLGVKYPTLVKVAVIERCSDQVKTIVNGIFPKNLPFQNPRKSLSHWSNMLRAIRRGD